MFWRQIIAIAGVLAAVSATAHAKNVQFISIDSYPFEVLEGPAFNFENNLHFFARDSATGAWRIWESVPATEFAPISFLPFDGHVDDQPMAPLIVGNDAFFSVSVGVPGIWRFDGNEITRLPGTAEDDFPFPEELVMFQGALHFRAAKPGMGHGLWRYNGGSATQVANTPIPTGIMPENFVVFRDELYFSGILSVTDGMELLRYDGVQATLAAAIGPGTDSSRPQNFVEFQNALYFSANSGELWRYTPEQGATHVGATAPGVEFSQVGNLTLFDHQLYFSATPSGEDGYRLMRFDGTDFDEVATISAVPYDVEEDDIPELFSVVGDTLFFTTDDRVHGSELWSYDGVAAKLFADIYPGPDSSHAHVVGTGPNGEVFIFAIDDSNRLRLGVLVPEPTTLALAIVGLIGLCARQCRGRARMME